EFSFQPTISSIMWRQRLSSAVVADNFGRQPSRCLAAPYLWHWRVNWKPKPALSEAEVPRDQRRLPIRPKVPTSNAGSLVSPGAKWHYTQSRAIFRGPELVHNKLIHKQFGVQALEAGVMLHNHFETIRMSLNRKLDLDRMFAVWRVDAPWMAGYKRPPGLTLGGGKRDPKFYKSPVKDERIILELGGNLDWQEAFRMLRQMAGYLPFKARFVSQEMLDFEQRYDQYVSEVNVNPFDFDFVRKHNLCNVERHLTPYAIKHGRRWW
uniref:Large ribosomal subunit protein uL16m n=2 Tax=Macrostomum lignano TaxID=282301 RepID=A0A1I8I6G2_9PLAT